MASNGILGQLFKTKHKKTTPTIVVVGDGDRARETTRSRPADSTPAAPKPKASEPMSDEEIMSMQPQIRQVLEWKKRKGK